MSRRTNEFQGKSAEQLRAEAAASRQRSEDSFERCDTDGFLSQWASDMTARLYEEQARIVEQGGKAMFKGLYHGERRVAAKLVEMPAYNRPHQTRLTWRLREDEVARFGRRFLPLGDRSRVQKALGLSEHYEMAAAEAKIGGSGRGLGGCASAYITFGRTGDEWGLDAERMPD